MRQLTVRPVRPGGEYKGVKEGRVNIGKEKRTLRRRMLLLIYLPVRPGTNITMIVSKSSKRGCQFGSSFIK